MRKLIVLAIVLALVMALAVSADARFQIKPETQAVGGGQSGGAGVIDNGATAQTPLSLAPPVATKAVGIYSGLAGIDGVLYQQYKLTQATGPWTYYGKVLNLTGATGDIDLRFAVGTSSTMLPPGTWYLYEGLAGVAGRPVAQLRDSGVFAVSENLWTSSTMGAVFHDGDYWTLTNQIPEPGSIVALLTGLVGLIGLRRRK